MNDRETGEVLDPKWNGDGLITGVVTDAVTGELLMVAHLNAEALALTRTTGEAHFWSRSRGRLWNRWDRVPAPADRSPSSRRDSEPAPH